MEAEVEIDGITILSVLPPKEKAAPSGRIEIVGLPSPWRQSPRCSSPKAAEAIAATCSTVRAEATVADRVSAAPQEAAIAPTHAVPRPARAQQRAQPSDAPNGARDPTARPAPGPRSPGPPGANRRRRGGRNGALASTPQPEAPPEGYSQPGEQRRPRPATGAGPRPGSPGERRPEARQSGAGLASAPQSAPRRSSPRFEPGTAHRDELFGGLAPEQRPIAERLAAGGIPAVRRAIAEERERARSEGRPEVSGDAILALAEQIAPSVKQAIWLDRAEAAVAQLEQLSLRDLRTTVAAAAPRDEAARDFDRKLREELDRRVKKLRSHWEEQMTHALEEGRVLQALRFSAQPPEPTARFPAALVERLATSAGAAMTSSTPVERWLAVLEAAVASPIRRQIHPEGLPEDASGEVMRKARLAAGSLPALAPMIGLSMPPPPKPMKSARPVRPPRPPARPAKRPVRTESSPQASRAESPDAAQDGQPSEDVPASPADAKAEELSVPGELQAETELEASAGASDTVSLGEADQASHSDEGVPADPPSEADAGIETQVFADIAEQAQETEPVTQDSAGIGESSGSDESEDLAGSTYPTEPEAVFAMATEPDEPALKEKPALEDFAPASHLGESVAEAHSEDDPLSGAPASAESSVS